MVLSVHADCLSKEMIKFGVVSVKPAVAGLPVGTADRTVIFPPLHRLLWVGRHTSGGQLPDLFTPHTIIIRDSKLVGDALMQWLLRA